MRARGWPYVVVLLLAVLAVGPMLMSRGFALIGDMVFVPHQPWKGQWLGADGSVPRAVPVDALVSLTTYLVPGDLLQKAILLLILCAAGWGALRLLDAAPVPARLLGALTYAWNPYVYERLAIGHWALLCGYAALPWLVVAALRLRQGERNAWVPFLAWLAVAGWTSPSGGVLAVVVALCILWRRTPVFAALGAGVIINLPWLLPGLLNAHGSSSDIAGVRAFAAAATQPGGVVVSVLSFGGIWKTAVAPELEAALLYSALGFALAMLGVVGGLLATRSQIPAARGLAVAALLGLVAALLPTSEAGADVIGWLVQRVPGAGLLRDSQKWIAPYVLFSCCGLAWMAERLARARASREPLLLLGALLAPVLVMPPMAWGLNGLLQPSDYPVEWTRVADELASAGASHGRTVVLPWSTYRRFGWSHQRAVLDPAFRFFPGQVITDDDLELTKGLVVEGENQVAAQIDAAVVRHDVPATLRRLGVGWVVLEKGTPDKGTPDAEAAQAPPGRTIHDGVQLHVTELPGVRRHPTSAHAGLLYTVDAAIFSAVLTSLAVGVWVRLRHSRILRRDVPSNCSGRLAG